MRTIEVDILSDQDEELILSVLRAFEQQNRVSLKEKTESHMPGKPFTESEFDQLVDRAEKSRTYSYEEAKAFLGL
ncbi:MAG: hypothetical protein EAZ91_22440 [Cytophagales bacterium]|nr:MAG: hypothetical protein EAZ91_22440 [Cytophagales bacterium]